MDNRFEDEKDSLTEKLQPKNNARPVYRNCPPKRSFFKKKVQWSDEDVPDRYIIPMIRDEQLPNNSIHTTKYNVFTFVPKNLMEQFSKLANVYFLLIGVLQTIDAISITDGKPIIYVPLAVIVAISALKDLVEDLQRRSDDRRENNEKTQRLTENGFEECKWMDLKVGDVIKVQNNEYIPADFILLKTSESDGIAHFFLGLNFLGTCYIETKNLDGETNLKPRSVDKTLLAYLKDEKILRDKNIEINYEKPNPNLYTFRGNIKLPNGKEVPLTNTNFLLRACSLRTSSYAIGLVAYTGHDTKIMLNSVGARPKSSKLDRMMNKQIIMVFVIQNVWCILIAIYSTIWLKIKGDEISSYLDYQSGDPEKNWFIYFLVKYGNWLVIFTNFVPISLLVTLEMVKFIQAYMLSKDPKMVDEIHHTRAVVQTSALMEELGQVNYIFSDKTGTLTRNVMDFKKVSIRGKSYGDDKSYKEVDKRPKVTNVDFKDKEFFKALENKNDSNHQNIHEMLFVLSTCHTCHIEEKENKKQYTASSPDELALVNFAKLSGYEYVGTNENNEILLEVNGKSEKHKLVHVLEFDSDRKRMSVVLETQGGEVLLFCKGADTVILDRISSADNPDIEQIKEHMEDYAGQGLRTLLIAKRTIPKEQFNDWSGRFMKASSTIQDREENMQKLMEEIEKELIVIGATAIEDKLQDQVGETIEAFKEAGIKVWVLTGDKTKTAINIGFSCKLLDKSQKLFMIDVQTREELVDKLKEVEEQANQRVEQKRPFALIITGKSLLHSRDVENDKELSDRLYNIFSQAAAVVGCRVSPKQKSDIVNLVKAKIPTAVTLAIGDGANDVNMITAAHVGVGIKGLEGYQAASASDFSVGEFKLIRRLLLFYGRESYRKNSLVVLYNFFKNQVLILPQFWYGFVNGMSGTALYEPVIFQLYNLFFASLPIVIFAIFDKEFSGSFLTQHPKYYKPGLSNNFFNYKLFWRWFFAGTLQAVFITLTAFGALEINSVNSDGRLLGFFSAGMMAFTSLIICTNLKIFLFTNSFSILVVFVVFASILFYIANFALFSGASWSQNYQEFKLIYGNWNFYFGTILMICMTTVIDLAISRYRYEEDLSLDVDAETQLKKQSSKKRKSEGRRPSLERSQESFLINL